MEVTTSTLDVKEYKKVEFKLKYWVNRLEEIDKDSLLEFKKEKGEKCYKIF